MSGNVAEWVQDCWHLGYFGAPPTDGSVWEEGGLRDMHVRRGGSYLNASRGLRSSSRDRSNYFDSATGFRLARDID